MLTFYPAIAQSTRFTSADRIVVPRPVALVSTVTATAWPTWRLQRLLPGGRQSAGGGLLSRASRSRRRAADPRADFRKDTLRNVEETGEFVVNTVSEAIAAAANASAAEVPPGVNEF